jgi:hypothetical protein
MLWFGNKHYQINAIGLLMQTSIGYGIIRSELTKAFLILPSAFLVVICFTLYFPYLLICLIQQHHPHVDPYNEAGEARTEVDSEYNRLMNCDESPYNFLYNVWLLDMSLI